MWWISKKGKEAAKESLTDLKSRSEFGYGFVLAGMGGGTGTGAIPVVAQLLRVWGGSNCCCNYAFEAEKARIDKAEFGLHELRETVDTVIVLDNNRLVDIAGQLPMEQAFAVANELVATMIKGIVETITLPSLINLDYADVSSIMKNGDVAVIGIGEDNSNAKVDAAVQQALMHPFRC